MKKVGILVFVLFICIGVSTAQPNGGFENWSPEFSYETPDGWQTFNILSLAIPPAPLSAFKVTGLDKHSGNYALKLKSVQTNNDVIQNIFGDTAGGTYTGKIIYSPFGFKYGFPYTSRPEKLKFWAKYFPVGNDLAGAIVFLSKWNGIGTDTVGLGQFDIPSTPNYSLFQGTITYELDVIPDTATIFFYTSKDPEFARLNSTLYIDDVEFTGWVGIDESKLNAVKVRAFPNPANENITIQVQNADSDKIILTDVSGRSMAEYRIVNDKVTVDTRLFVNGFYFYEVRNSENRSLARGKFNVLR